MPTVIGYLCEQINIRKLTPDHSVKQSLSPATSINFHTFLRVLKLSNPARLGQTTSHDCFIVKLSSSSKI